MAEDSIVEYFKEHEGYRCGYCGKSDTNYSNGMWAHKMTCQDYQDLIDRGWRRSGKYCYKPMMKVMCCPSYTIKCKVLHFKASKSQKKVLKQMTKYLTTSESKESGKNEMDKSKSEKSETSAKALSRDRAGTEVSKSEKSRKKESCPGIGADAGKPPCRKAKVVRMERKQQKLIARGIKPDTTQPPNQKQQNQEKSLEDLLLEHTNHSNLAHKLEIKMVRADMSSREFKKSFKDSHRLYQKYQVAIHKDDPSKCTEQQFQRFLVDSPLQHYKGPGAPAIGFGTFHQQYYIDGVLVTVGVLDILPHCISSVYLFYDPDYSFLTPGVYSAQREIYLTQQLHKEVPSIEFYYMGFYIHSCPKMKYKGNYYPSYLACPETYNWFPIEDCKPKLDVHKYSRLDESSSIPPSTDINQVLILHQRQIMPFQIYVVVKTSSQNDSDLDSEDENGDTVVDIDTIQEYANLVGPQVAKRMLLYRS